MLRKKTVIFIVLCLFFITSLQPLKLNGSVVELNSRYQENIAAQQKVIEDLKEISFELGELGDSIEAAHSQIINKGVRGRWLIYGRAGERIVESVSNAKNSIILMARMFDIESGPMMKKMADKLIEKAEAGKEVIIILSEKFPINYFHQVNQHAFEYFEGTPVQLKKASPVGCFNRDLEYFPNKESNTYVNSAVLLVDGIDLIAGTYILTDHDLSTGQSNIIQLRGLEVYEKVKPNIDAVFDILDLNWEMTEEKARQALTGNFVHWAPLEDFQFYLGVYSTPVFKEIYEKARYSLRLLTHRPSTAWRTGVVGRAVELLVETTDNLLEKEIFYGIKSTPPERLNIVDILIDAGYEAYKFNEDESQYHRAALSDDYWFYTGTVELSLIYIQGWHLQSVVTGGSARLGAELKEWIDARRQNAVAKHQEYKRFKINEPPDSLGTREQSALDFLKKELKPAFERENLEQIIQLLSERAAESISKRYLRLLNRSSQIEVDHYRSFFEKAGLDPESFIPRDIEKDSTWRNFLQKVVDELVAGHPAAREVFNKNFVDYMNEKIFKNINNSFLVETEDGYRVYDPDLLSVERGFEWTIKLKEAADDWELYLLN
ncbi:MAG: hypothetical protein ACLFN5_03180, partial [bacterium]